MSTNKHGLGRGIDVLFRNSPPTSVKETEEQGSSQLPLAVLRPSPYQPRRVFEDQPLQELADSIRSQGIVQPLLVRPIAGGTHYEIIAGERRFRAAKLVGLSEVPVVIRSMTDDEAITVALIENLQREDLNPLEEAEAMHALRERLGESQEALASRIGKSRSAVANALRLLQLPADMRQALAGNLFTPGHARAVLSVPEEDVQRQLYDAIVTRQLSVRDAESAVQHYKRTGRLPALLVSSDETIKAAGPRSPKPELIRDVQRVLRETLGSKVTVSGSGDIGRVTIPYESAEHLAALMRLICAGQMQESTDSITSAPPASRDTNVDAVDIATNDDVPSTVRRAVTETVESEGVEAPIDAPLDLDDLTALVPDSDTFAEAENNFDAQQTHSESENFDHTPHAEDEIFATESSGHEDSFEQNKSSEMDDSRKEDELV